MCSSRLKCVCRAKTDGGRAGRRQTAEGEGEKSAVGPHNNSVATTVRRSALNLISGEKKRVNDAIESGRCTRLYIINAIFEKAHNLAELSSCVLTFPLMVLKTEIDQLFPD